MPKANELIKKSIHKFGTIGAIGGFVLVPTESNSRSNFIESISKNVVLIMGKVD
jgi:hypothetical protein